MTFKQYIEAIGEQKISFIEETCNGRFVETHHCFGFNEAEANIDPDAEKEFDLTAPDQSKDFVLYDTDGCENTYIDPEQTIVFDGKGVKVNDRDNNELVLYFFTGLLIPHPVEN